MKTTDQISLRPIVADNVFAFIKLSDTLRDGQQLFVASNAVSLAQAYSDPQAWPRGIYCGDTPVGFLMLQDDPAKSEYFLWRLMIGGESQGKGYGRRAIELLVDYVRTRPGATELLVSYVPGEGSPEKFYEALGFLPNGKMYDDEVGLVLSLEAKVLPPAAEPPPPALVNMAEYTVINRDNWNKDAHNWVASGRKAWGSAPAWGIWGISNSELPLLPQDMQGLDAIELGCGTGYVSSWMQRRGARVVGIDPSEKQLDTARMLAGEHKLEIEWIHGVAEQVPKADASFDFAISEYGAAIWSDPYVWIPEAHRLLRPSGELVFFGNSPWAHICTPFVADGKTEDRLHQPYFGMHRLDWSGIEAGGGIEFCLTIGDWIRLFDDTGFDVVDYREVRAPDSASKDNFAVDVEWAKRFPAEHAWRLRKRA